MMKQSTSFAQVANNLLTVLQGYSKTIRLLLVMFLTLTVTTNVWGAEETITLSNFGWSNATVQSSITATSATISLAQNSAGTAPTYYTDDGLRLYGVNSATTGGTISFTPKTGITISKIVFTHGSKNSGVLAIKTGEGSYSSSTKTWEGTLTEGNTVSLVSTNSGTKNPQVKITKIVITYETAVAHTVTWTINPAAGGTLSATSGNSTTVSPNAAYTYGASAYTVTSGAATVSQSGNTFTATPTANCTIQINMVEKTPANISFENMGNPTPTTTGYYVGDTYTLPATNDYTCGDKTFVGWSTEIIENSPTKPTAATYFEPGASVTLAANQTFYAVFATSSGNGSGYTKLNWGATISAGKYLISTGNYTISGRSGNKTSELAVVEYSPTSNEAKTEYEVKIEKIGDYFSIKLPDDTWWVGWNTSTSTNLTNTSPNNDTKYLWRYTENGIQNISADTRYLQVNYVNTAAKVYTTTNNNTWHATYLYAQATSYSDYTTQCSTEPSDCSLLNFASNIEANYSATYAQNATANALTVSAEYNSNSTGVTYQWYSNTTNSSTGGTSINGASSASYTPSTAVVGTTYYYCIATYDECTITSNVATIIVANIPTYTITWLDGQGNTIKQESLPEGSTITPPTTPTRTGYTFNGWDPTPATQMGTSDLTYTAQWIAKTIIITWNQNYTDCPEAATSTYIYDGEVIKMPDDPIRTGYKFNGWFTASSGGTQITDVGNTNKPAENTIYYAQWTEKTAPNISWSASTCTVTIASPSNELPTLNNPNSLSPIVYSSSATGVATIDDQGRIILKSAGETTITAAFAETEDYKSAEVTYTLTVVESDNCRWIETDIEDIEYGDEVIITMTNGVTTWALDQGLTEQGYPKAVEIIGITNFEIPSNQIYDEIKWNILGDAVTGYIFHPVGDDSKSLYCGKTTLKVGVSTENTFTITNGFLTHSNTTDQWIRYVAVASSAQIPDWRPYEATNGTIENQSQTLKFYKRICLSEGQYWVKWMVAGQEYTAGDPTTFTDGTITAIPTDPADDAIGNCANKFMGWSTDDIGSTPDADAPTDLFTTVAEAQSKIGGITENKTFYAVFATASGISDVFSRVTELSQLEDGNTLAIVAEQSGGQIFGTGTDHKGGAAPVESDGKITISVSTNKWILEEVDGGWKLLKDKNNKLCADAYLGYTAYGDTLTIEDSQSDEYFFIRSSNNYLEYYSNTWQFYQIKSTPTSSQNGYVCLKIYKSNVSYSNYVTSCCETPAPTNGTFNNVTGSGNAMSLTLNWEGTASRYHITCANPIIDDHTESTSYHVSSLTECEEYTFYVSADPEEGCESAAIQISAQPFSGAKTVTFVYGNEQPNTTFTTDCDNQSTALPTPTRSGYRFLGWFTKESGGTEITENPYTPTTDITLHAQWVQVFTVTYDPNNATSGTVPTDANSPYDINKIVTVQGNTGNLQRLGYNFVGWNTAIDASGTQYSVGQTFTITENTTLYAQWIENYCTLTFTIPSGGGQAVSAPEQVLNGYPITFPEVTGISSEYWCETFIGWTTEEPNGEGLWDGTPTIYGSGTNSEAITANTTFYAVYQRSGGGASGSVDLKCADVSKWKSDVLSGNSNAYGTVTTRTATDGSVWTTNGQIADAGDINLKEEYYLKLPELPGSITTIRMKVSQGNCTDACGDYAGNETEYKVNFKSTTDGNVLFSSESTESRSRTIEITDGTYYTGYLYCSSGTLNVHAVSVDYGPAPIISHSLQCGCAIDEFNLTYDANETNFPNSTTNCEGVTGYKFSEHEDKYTICSSVPTLDGYKFIGWTTNANGSGDLYTSGQEIKCVPSSDITLYAQYERVYTVIFDDQNTINATTQTRSGAAVDVPTATEPCGSEWQFVGWSTEEIAPMSLKPTITIEPGINTYIPEGNVTLYAIYQKTSLSKEFVAGKTGAYKISNGSDKYASTFYSSYLQSVNNLADATTYYITYTASDGGKYTIQQADGMYIAYSGESTSLKRSEEPYYWKITKDGELWQVTTIPAGRYLKYSTEFRAYQEAGNIGLIATEGQYYYRTMSCDDNFDITFNNQNGAIIHWQNGYPQAAYQDLEGGTTITTFPTASYEGWTFIGWRAQEYEESTSAPESSSVYGGLDGISGNALTITANVTMYPVFTQFLDNDPFDEVNGGDYYMYYIADKNLNDPSLDEYGATNRIYAGEYNDYSFRSTQSCADATLFTFAKLPNGKWTIYDNTRDKFVYGVNNDNKLEDKAQTADGNIKYVKEWTIEVNKGNQVNAVSVDGYILSAFTQDAKSGTFKNYDDDNLTNGNGNQYHRVYLGTCTERVFTTAPSTVPIITLNGDVKVTSTATQSVKAASVLTVSASNIATSNLSITSDNAAFIVSPATITVVDKKVGVTPITITYKPTITSDGTETATITVSDGNEASESITVTGRHLPENFVIAAKVGNIWYALPSQGLNSTTPPAAYPVEVDDMADPTTVTAVPENADWSLRQVYASSGSNDRFKQYGANIMFENNASPAKMLNANTSGNYLLTDAEYSNYYETNPGLYEWTPTTTDLETYTLTNAQRTDRTLNVATNTVFGVHFYNKATTEVRFLPIQNRYTPAALQVVEWKENSVVIMYNGDPAQTASVSVNGGAAQETVLSSAQRDIAVYELAATGLAANPTQRLSITIGAEKVILSIPYIISGAQTDLALLPGSTVAARQEAAKVSDLVILKGATLTAAGAKGNPYKFRNVTVYGGGKLVVPADNGFGVNSLTLRIGGVTADGNYDYVYPEFVLNTNDGAYSNTSGKINLDYVTTKEQYYTFVAPFAVNTKDIKYPVDIYGNNVAANKGSFEFQYYDGAERAKGNTGWKVVEEDPTNGATLTAHQGYTFLGMPKKVSVNGGTSTRQKFGIHRIPMTVAAGTAMTHETTDQTAPLSVYLCDKNNNSGWNLIGNPYMSTIGGLTNENIQVGKLVHTIDANGNWTGGWHWDEETVQSEQRFLVIPRNDGQSYDAVQASNATLPAFKNFFVQISNESANALSIPVANRVEKSLAPARYAEEQPEKDVEVAIVLEQDEAHSDQMDFLINNIYTEDFERDADFTKMMNATNLNLYGVHPYDNLSFVAIDNNTARGSVAIGYQVPQAGEYILRMSDKPYVMFDRIEALYVTDHEMSPEVTTDIMSEPYRFTVANAETNHTRFTVSITLKANTEDDVTTILENVDVGKDQPIKFFYQDKLYILRNGVIYDAMGKQVQTINK